MARCFESWRGWTPAVFLAALGCTGGEASLLDDHVASDERARRMNITVVSEPSGERSEDLLNSRPRRPSGTQPRW